MRAVSVSSDGTLIAVGYGRPSGPGRSRKDGGLQLLHASNLVPVLFMQETTDWICDIKFSPNNAMVAVSTQVCARLRVWACTHVPGYVGLGAHVTSC